MASRSDSHVAPQEHPALGKMTGPERAFLECVQARMARGEIVWWRYQPFSLRLPHGDRYTPDYVEVERGGLIVAWEVKGKGGFKGTNFGKGATRGDGGRSRLAFHTAVEEYPFYRFRTAFQRRKKDGGGFLVEDHHPKLGFSRGTAVPPEPTPGEVEDCECDPTPAKRSCFMHGDVGEELIHEPGCPAQPPALRCPRCPRCVCECELRNRAWDPNTGRCRSCGLPYKESDR